MQQQLECAVCRDSMQPAETAATAPFVLSKGKWHAKDRYQDTLQTSVSPGTVQSIAFARGLRGTAGMQINNCITCCRHVTSIKRPGSSKTARMPPCTTGELLSVTWLTWKRGLRMMQLTIACWLLLRSMPCHSTTVQTTHRFVLSNVIVGVLLLMMLCCLSATANKTHQASNLSQGNLQSRKSTSKTTSLFFLCLAPHL